MVFGFNDDVHNLVSGLIDLIGGLDVRSQVSPIPMQLSAPCTCSLSF